MRKSRFFAAVSLMLVSTTIFAASVTPKQLKEARMATYQWVRDYNVYARMEGKRNPEQKFINLFEGDSLLIFNDCLPDITTNGEQISVRKYASILAKHESCYKMSFDITNARIVAEKIDDEGNILFTLEFDKSISFQEKENSSDNRYAYPEKSYHATIIVEYNLREGKAFAKEFSSNVLFDDIVVLHDTISEFVNRYTTQSELKMVCDENKNALVKWNYTSTVFDPQMMYFYQDTIKNSFHFGGAVGASFYISKLINDNFYEWKSKAGFSYALSLGYYRQLVLKRNNRFGIDISASFLQKNYGFKAKEFHESYSAVDPDGGSYQRLIDLDNYHESIKCLVVDIPIGLRYDYMVNDDLSLFLKFGASVSYDIVQKASFSASALYSGHYDWLFDVTISQNGIYDFGSYDIEGSTNEISIERLSVGVFAGFGLQYFIPKSKWSIEAVLQYSGNIYSYLENDENFHLTMNNIDWRSASYLFKSYYGQNIQFQLNFNYNF